ncbi:hypothetical protein GDO86_012746 [Hymenochirus boettgeri]|uniref:FDX-ACB domain-containing protein n=1 Tax=Hymenochirus boettgeri TaxID=247094 RepID=A0A8T2ITU5_9PIPI|nr:hypothetical protein GDO86_012746 [Hymenochirus boettgeri]
MEEHLKILLVGEGNFSFSLWLCDSSNGKYDITATCIELEDQVCRQPKIWANVQHLRERGAVVHFSVDATNLKDNILLANKLYDRVIFNFPHYGRKAGIKKNRVLLTRFFLSCADVLTQKGDIHVALCKGQGGTPADQPMREWHNSWQVVAMASKAGFILSSVAPFESEQHSGYKCTGYRSQEKSFHVEGSLNHIFTRSLPLETIKTLKIISKLTDVLEEEENKAYRDLLEWETCHPTNIVHERLIDFMENCLTLESLDDTFPLMCKPCSRLHLYWCPVPESALYFVPSKNGDISIISSYYEDKKKTGCELQSSRLHYLRPSLTHFTNDIIEKQNLTPGVMYSLSGPVFRKCLASCRTMPVYHELMLLCRCKASNIEDQTQLLLETFSNAMAYFQTSILNKANKVKDQKKVLTFQDQFSREHCSKIISCNYGDYIVGTITAFLPEHIDCNFANLSMTLNLDLLTMCLLNIDDWRMLWTHDERFIQQYNPPQLKIFESFSLYPPYYTHDISFWVGEGSEFDNQEFHILAMRVSKGTISNIQLLDQYENVDTRMTSLCYRIIYQSCDMALSYEDASEMQLLLRKELQKSFHVVLR